MMTPFGRRKLDPSIGYTSGLVLSDSPPDESRQSDSRVVGQCKMVLPGPACQATEDAWQKLGKEGFAGTLMVMDKERDRIEKQQDLRSQEFGVASLRAAITQSEQRIAQVTSTYSQQLLN